MTIAVLRRAGGMAALCTLLLAVNALAWGWAWAAFADNAVLLGAALLAYSFGLRHAVDADHIAAIDNATRKLIEADQPGAMTGFYFSLGHATVVVAASLAVALTAAGLPQNLIGLKPLAGTIATGFSALCLFALAIANTGILLSIIRVWRSARRGGQAAGSRSLDMAREAGVKARLFRGLFRLVSKSWHMYPVGFLFGLSFDTATEIGVLGVSAAQASQGLPLAAIMVFPALFAAGMTLIDTVDAILMSGAYRWASRDPVRRIRYNLVVTLASVIVATAIGGAELLGLCGQADEPNAPFWRAVAYVNDHLAMFGSLTIGFFIACWVMAMLLFRTRSGPLISGRSRVA